MHLANVLLFVSGLVLESVLLALLVRRRLACRVPLFTAILVFYLLRSLTLFATASHISGTAQGHLVSALAVLDLMLQLALAISLFFRVAPPNLSVMGTPGPYARTLLVALGLVAAMIGTTLLIRFTPPRAPAPLDRGAILSGFYFLVLFSFAGARIRARGRILGPASLATGIFQGLAAFAVVQIASQWGRAVASSRHNPAQFLFWIYLDAAAWLVVVLFWIQQVRPPSLHAQTQREIAQAADGAR